MDKIKAFFDYSRTILAARLYSLVGVLVALQGAIIPWVAGQDWTPIFNRLFKDIPDDVKPLVIGAVITATGELFVYMRKITDKSLEEKVIVGQAAEKASEAVTDAPPSTGPG